MKKFFCEIFGGCYIEGKITTCTIGRVGKLGYKIDRIRTRDIPLKILALRIWWLKTKIAIKNKI